MEKHRYIVIDTETTGLGYGAEVLQFSAVDQDGKTVMNVYVKPVRADEWPETEAVHHISPADVADCPTMFRGGIGRKITALLESYPLVVGYNVAFDLQMLRQSGCRVPPDLSTQDVMHLFAPVYGEWNAEKQDYKWQKLDTCARYYRYDRRDRHNSLEDAKATWYCYKMVRNTPRKESL